MKVFLFLLSINLGSLFLNAQQKTIDSLKNNLNHTEGEAARWELLNELTKVYKLEIRDYDSAYIYSKMAINSADALDDDLSLANSFFQMGSVQQHKNHLDSSIFYLEKAMNYSTPAEQPKLFGNIYNTLGITYSEIPDYQQSVKAFELALGYFDKSNDQKMLGWTYSNLGLVQSSQGNFDKSIASHFSALKISERLLDQESMLIDYNNLGVAYGRKEDIENMTKYYRMAYDLSIEIDDPYKIGSISSNMVNVYIESNQYDSAYTYATKALQMANEIGDQRLKGFRTHKLAEVAYHQQDFKRAEDFAKSALDICLELEDQELEATCYRTLGMIYQAKGYDPLASTEYEKSIAIFSSLQSRSKLIHVLRRLSETKENQGKYEEALKYHKRYKTLSDSIAGESLEAKVAELELKYETGKKQLKIEQLITENESKAALAQTRLWIILLGSMCFVALAFIFYFRIKLNKQRSARLKAENKQNELALSLKRQELTGLSLNLTQKNEALEKLKRKIQSDKKEWSSQDTIKFIEENMAMDAGWDHFKMHFEKVHQGFFDRLRSIAPAITLNEQKLCAYLVLNLSSKEIAQLLHTSLSAVEKSRYRLRKKLQMNPETNLTSFIQNV